MGRRQAGAGRRVSRLASSPAPTHATTSGRTGDGFAARRDLTLAAVAGVGLSRLLDGDSVWLVAGLLLAGMLLGALQVLAEDDPAAETSGVPIESVILPAVATIACLGAIRLVPFGLWLAPALVGTGLIVERCLAIESRILTSRSGAGPDDRTAVLIATLLVAFLAFAGVATLVPGGFSAEAAELSGAATNLPLLAAADALVAFLLGYRVAALRVTRLRDALWSAATYALAIAIGAAALRAMEIPRLVGPALLTLVFYLWDAFHGASARRRDSTWIWQTVLLVVLGLIVVAWNQRVLG
jgi:hypothetical protein